MKPASQSTLLGSLDWREPQTVRGAEFLAAITGANAAGFRAVRVTVRGAAYRCEFARIAPPDAPSASVEPERGTVGASQAAGLGSPGMAIGNR